MPPLSQCGGGGNTGRYTHMHTHKGTYKYTDKHKRRRHTNTERYTTHRAIQHTQIHTHGNRDMHTHNVWVTGRKEDQVFSLCVTADLYLPVFLCVSVDAIRVRVSPAFVLRCAVFPPPPATHRHKVSFSQLAEGVEGGKGGEAGRGWAGKLLSSAAQAAVPSQGQVSGPAASAAPGRDRTAPGELPEGAGNLGPIQPPGTWGPARVTAREPALPAAVGALGREGGLEPGPVPTAAFLPPRESPGRPPTPGTSGRTGIPLPGPQRPAP